MNDILDLIPSLVTGMLLGVIFFGGLWLTVGKGLSSIQPATWFIGSLLLRTSMTLGGFYLVSNGQWERLLACLLGFTIVRPIVTRLTRLPESPPILEQTENHAP